MTKIQFWLFDKLFMEKIPKEENNNDNANKFKQKKFYNNYSFRFYSTSKTSHYKGNLKITVDVLLQK